MKKKYTQPHSRLCSVINNAIIQADDLCSNVPKSIWVLEFIDSSFAFYQISYGSLKSESQPEVYFSSFSKFRLASTSPFS